MRYTQLAAFHKHLASSAPHNLCRVYLITCTDAFERKTTLDSILSYAATPDSLIARFSGSDVPVREILDALNSPRLFGGEPIVVVDEMDKKLHDALSSWFKEPPSFGYLFMGSKGKISGSFAETHGAILDLTEEKPWDRDKRWIEKLHTMAKSAGKRLNADAASLIFERLDCDAALLSFEMDKLLCYCADKQDISRADVEAVCRSSRSYSLWQVAEELVWEKTFRANESDLSDSSFFHGLIAGMRQQLIVGAKMCALKQSAVPFGEWRTHFPKIWPKALEKKAHLADHLGAAYFRKGLNLLFQIELLSKSGPIPTDALIDYFRIKV